MRRSNLFWGCREEGGTRTALSVFVRIPTLVTATVAALLVGVWPVGIRAADTDSIPETVPALRAAGRFDEALDELRSLSREIKSAEGDDSLRLLPINDLAVEILIDKEELETAATLLAKTISRREKLVASAGREHVPALGRSLLTLSRLETKARRPTAAVAAARRSLLLIARTPEGDEEAVVRARNSLQTSLDALDAMLGSGAGATQAARNEAAAAFASLGMFSEAVEQRRIMLAGLMKDQAAEATEIFRATDQLGRLMATSGHAEEALPVVEKVLTLLGQKHPHEATATHRLLGDVQVAAGRLALAEGSFAQVLESTLADGKPSAVTLAGDRLRCLLVALRRGKVDGLPQWFDSAAKALANPPASEMANAIPAAILAAQVKEAVQDPAAAAAFLGPALATASSVKSAVPEQVAELAARLASMQLAAGKVAEARKTAERALSAAERDVGPGGAPVGSLRMLLADALHRQGDSVKAVQLVDTAVDHGLPRPDEAWEVQAIVLVDRLAAAASDMRERYLALRARQFGSNHAHVASACSLFGAARLAAGDWTGAVDFLRRAVEVRRGDPGGERPETAADVVLLAHAQRMAGQSKQAVETAERGLAMWERVAGAAHPGSLTAAAVLVAAKRQAGDTNGVMELLERLTTASAVADPIELASHLVWLADLAVARDKIRTKQLLQHAMQLPCWQEGVVPSPAARLRLALTAARAANVFRAVGDATAAERALQQARSLSLDADNPRTFLERIEQLASRGEEGRDHGLPRTSE